MRESNLAWLAGFFEGEGCISTSITDRRSYVDRAIHFNLTQKDPWPLFKAREILLKEVGVTIALNITNRNFKKGQKQYWQLQTARPDVIEKIVDAIWDHLSPRRQIQIMEAMEEYEAAESNTNYSKRFIFRGRLQLLTDVSFEAEVQEFLRVKVEE